VDSTEVPEALFQCLGAEATAGLIDLLEKAERTVTQTATETVLTRSVERFERRLVEEISTLRVEMHAMRSELRAEIADQKFELLKWSFLFWIGQVAAIAALMRLMR
jgi:hypothetical protein